MEAETIEKRDARERSEETALGVGMNMMRDTPCLELQSKEVKLGALSDAGTGSCAQKQ